MFDQVIVPLDGSDEAARALRPATTLAHRLDVPMRVVTLYASNADPANLRAAIFGQLRAVGHVEHEVEAIPATKSVAEHLEEILEAAPDALLVMSTRGHGRTAAFIGSVANHVLGATDRPVFLVGPACDANRFRLHGPMVVAADGTELAESVIDAAVWATDAFEYEPIVVNVVDPNASQQYASAAAGAQRYDMPVESTMVQRLAKQLGQRTGTTPDFEVLHNERPHTAIVDHAEETRAPLIVMATHARSGLDRLKQGSVTAEVLQHGSCPVLAVAPTIDPS